VAETTHPSDRYPPASDPSPSAHARGAEFARQAGAALERLPDQTHAAIVRMYVVEGLGFAQIAERLGLGDETVRERYWATVNKLQLDLKDWL